MRKNKRPVPSEPEQAAGNGLLDRRFFLTGTAAAIGSAAMADQARAAEALPVESWMQTPGSPFVPYGQPSKYTSKVARVSASAPGTTGTGASRTPHHLLDGMITPNGLHFERHHSGIPDINPETHRLLIHGLVKRPLVYTLDALMRYPMVSRIAFIECAGNSGLLYQKEPAQLGVQPIHGLLSCAEWTGVRLATLLEDAGVDPRAQWILAEGADASGMSRSVPLDKAMDDALVAIYQNGEPVRPSNGYPMRLLLPGYEGNMNVKWLRRIKLTEGPTMTKDETSKYTMLQNDGKSLQFCFVQEAKSVITRPSPGPDDGGARVVRDHGSCLVGLWTNRESRRLRRRRRKLGAGRAAGAGAADGVDALSLAMALGWRSGDAAEPCRRRFRIRAADAVEAHRRSRCQGELPFQRHCQLGSGTRRRGPTCLCVTLCLRPVRRSLLGSWRRAGGKPEPREAREPRGNRLLGHRHRPRRRRPAVRRRNAAARRAGLSRQMPRVPRRERRGQAERPTGRRPRIARSRSSAGQNRRQFLALCHDPLRLRAARHAAERIQIAPRRGGICGGRLHLAA